MSSSHGSFGADLSISAKGLLLVAIPVIAQIAVFSVLWSVQANLDEAERWAIHSKDVILRADEIQRLTLEGIASQRAAVVTGDADYQDVVNAPARDIQPRIDGLFSLVADNAAQQERLGQLKLEAQALDEWLASQRDLVRQGRQAEAIQHVRDREGSEHLEKVRSGLAAFVADEQHLAGERSVQLRRVTLQSRWLTILSTAVSLGVACVLGFLFSRAIGSRFAVVTSNAESLAKGAPLTPPLHGSDEIASLDRVLHETGERLAAASAAADRAHHELEERLTQLAQLNLELRQQTEENEAFIYSVSHDLRSPLVNLQGFSKELTMTCTALSALIDDESLPQSFRTRAAELIDREIAESLTFIRSAVSRSSLIIDSLLRLSRAGRVEYRWQLVHLTPIVRNVIDAMRSTINQRKAEITVHPMEDAWGDTTAIEQVFANLIGNAVSYLDQSRPGRIDVGMADVTPPRSTDADVPSTIPTRTYYVRDNGLGLPESAMAKVFTAFHRHHSNHAAGEGVGLALVRRIVERHAGRIWVESTEGVGSTFYVALPVEAPAAAAGTRSDRNTESASSRPA